MGSQRKGGSWLLEPTQFQRSPERFLSLFPSYFNSPSLVLVRVQLTPVSSLVHPCPLLQFTKAQLFSSTPKIYLLCFCYSFWFPETAHKTLATVVFMFRGCCSLAQGPQAAACLTAGARGLCLRLLIPRVPWFPLSPPRMPTAAHWPEAAPGGGRLVARGRSVHHRGRRAASSSGSSGWHPGLLALSRLVGSRLYGCTDGEITLSFGTL